VEGDRGKFRIAQPSPARRREDETSNARPGSNLGASNDGAAGPSFRHYSVRQARVIHFECGGYSESLHSGNKPGNKVRHELNRFEAI
jgi:hypothetical protein